MVQTQDVVSPAYESGLDWLSLTAPLGSDAAARLCGWCEAQQDEETRTGAAVIETAPQGYHGRRVGRVFFGVGRYGWLFQISSALSNDALEFIKQESNDFRATRIDFQVGQRFDQTDDEFPARMRGLIRGAEEREGTAKKNAIVLYEANNNGLGLAVGSRRSESYFRIYNKTLESKLIDCSNLWRFEVETKRELSRSMWKTVCEAPDVPRLCRSVVSRKLSKLRLPVPFLVEEPNRRFEVARTLSNDERRVEWFTKTVLPVVAKIEDAALRARMIDAFYSAME